LCVKRNVALREQSHCYHFLRRKLLSNVHATVESKLYSPVFFGLKRLGKHEKQYSTL